MQIYLILTRRSSPMLARLSFASFSLSRSSVSFFVSNPSAIAFFGVACNS
jgi:hypothetical protein